ncbi:MAG: hypothetical protein PWP19_858 [Thermococcaceae archaeon]|nr:hypothetical protein [Thermococcaceae archaeon]
MRVRALMFLAEGVLATLHPWLAALILIGNWIAKPRMKYYSRRKTSLLFLAGMSVGFMLGYGLFKEHLQLWWSYKDGLFRTIAGTKNPVWILIILVGLGIWGILRGSRDEGKD